MKNATRVRMYGDKMMVLDSATCTLSLYAVKDIKAPLEAMIAVGEPVKSVSVPAEKVSEFAATSIERNDIRSANPGWERYA